MPVNAFAVASPGIGSAYGPPVQAELVLAGAAKPPAELAQELLATLDRRSII